MDITENTINEIKKLSTPEKIIIVEEIWDSIGENEEYPELTESQSLELNKRLESYHKNPHQGRTWDEIKADYGNNR